MFLTNDMYVRLAEYLRNSRSNSYFSTEAEQGCPMTRDENCSGPAWPGTDQKMSQVNVLNNELGDSARSVAGALCAQHTNITVRLRHA